MILIFADGTFCLAAGHFKLRVASLQPLGAESAMVDSGTANPAQPALLVGKGFAARALRQQPPQYAPASFQRQISFAP